MKFEKFGEGKYNLIFLHGWGADKNSFLWLKDCLYDCQMHFATLDGFGGLSAPKDTTITGYAKRVMNYIQQNKLSNVIVVGHSFGGRIAIELSKHVELSGLVLVDSAGIKPKLSLKRTLKVCKYKICKCLLKLRIISKDKLEKFGSNDYKNCSREMKKVFMNAINYNQIKQLCNIVTPTLIVWGRDDKETPMYMARIMHKKIKNSELVIIDGGHFCFLENALQFVSVLQYFFDRIKERSK